MRDLVEIPAFQEHVAGLLRVGSGETSHVAHFRVEKQIFVVVRFIHEQTVHAELLESDDIILAGIVVKTL